MLKVTTLVLVQRDSRYFNFALLIFITLLCSIDIKDLVFSLSFQDDQLGTKTSSVKHEALKSTNTPSVLPISIKGPNKGSTNKVNQLIKVQQDKLPNPVSPQQSHSTASESDNEATKPNDMEIPDTKEHEQAKLDDSSPKIPNHDEDGQNDEDETMPDVDEEIQAEKGPHKTPMDNIVATNPSAGIVKEPIISSNVTNTPLTQEELDNLKKDKPTEYLKAMMSARASSMEKGSSSLTSYGHHYTVEIADQLLQ